MTQVDLRLEANQTEFIVFRHPAKGLDPVATVTRDGAPEFAACVAFNANGRARLENAAPGVYTLKHASSAEESVTVSAPPAPVAVGGPWEVAFPIKADEAGLHELVAPFPDLISWSLYENPAIKYFSGTATYRKRVTLPTGFVVKNRQFFSISAK